MSEQEFPKHIAVVVRGELCVATCLRCGYSVEYVQSETAKKLIQDHTCLVRPVPAEIAKLP